MTCVLVGLIGSLTALVTGQAPPGPSVGVRVDVAMAAPTDESPAGKRMLLGDAALAAGEIQQAAQHYLAALERHPASPAILRALLRTAANDADARLLYAQALANALCDERGRVTYDREDKALLPAADDGKALAAAQSAARAGALVRRRAHERVAAAAAADLPDSVVGRGAVHAPHSPLSPSPSPSPPAPASRRPRGRNSPKFLIGSQKIIHGDQFRDDLHFLVNV